MSARHVFLIPAAALALLAFPGCDGEGDDDDSAAQEGPWSVLADHVPGGTLLSAWSDGDDVVFVGGGMDGSTGVIARYSSGGLCTEEGAADDTLWWIHGPRPGEWYAVGTSGTILHETDGSRVDESVDTTATLYGVWAADPEHVYAVGGDVAGTGLGEIWVREDGAWSLLEGEIPGVVFKVWEDWFVGDGIVLHREDGAQVDRTPDGAPRLLTVRGRSDDDVWAVGGNSTPVLVHWDGTAWSEVTVDPACATQPLNGVFTAPGDDVWIAGNFGTMAAFDGQSWSCPPLPVTGEHFHAVWGAGDEVLWAGGNMFTMDENYGTIGRHAGDVSSITVQPCG